MRARIVLAAGLALSMVGLAGCSDDEQPAAAEALQPELELTQALDEPVRIGVLVPPIEGAGSEFRPLVEGVRIAGYRFELGGTEVEFSVALDDGTAEGASAAMTTLIEDDVAGVVLAGQADDHITDALEVADDADTAVVLPYAEAEGDGVWSVAPSAEAVQTQVESALAEADAERPYLALAQGRELDLNTAQTVTIEDTAAMADAIVAALEAREIDSVVIDASAQQQAELVVALQGRLGSRQLPIVLTPEALTPTFGDLLSTEGTTAGWMFSVGTDTGDHVALNESESGNYAAVFFSAMRLAVGDIDCENIYADDSCAAGAPRADIASHDATVALFRAVDAAGSTDAAQVRAALGELSLDYTDGLAGPALDFTQSQALSDDEVVVLHASTSDPGLRPEDSNGNAAASLFWFSGTSS